MMLRFILFIGVTSTFFVFAILILLPSPRSTLPTLQPINNTIYSEPTNIDFQDVTLDWGVVATHTQSSKYLTALNETLGSGICAFDFNQDGWMDLFFIGGSGHSRNYGKKSWWNNGGGNRLLLNIEGKHFEDVTEQAGLSKRMWGMGCAIGDINNNGLKDLLVTGVGSNTLYQNKGNGTFEDITTGSGLDSEHWSTGASFGDFNRDGLLDIYISNYISYKKGSRIFEHSSGFKNTSSVAFNPTLYDPEQNQLLINKGNFIFEDVASKTGVANSQGRSLGARWVDLNQDNWLDLIVINDHNSPNQVFINQQGKFFSRGKEQYAAFEVAGAHDLLIADFDNNGKDDFFMSRGINHPPVLLNRKTGFTIGDSSIYRDSAWVSNLAQTRLLPFTSWGSTAGDFNNDGSLDIYVANGMAIPDIDSHFVAQAQANTLFVNHGNRQFKKHNSKSHQQHPYSSRSAISIDLNNDGKLEVLVSNNNGPLQIFENQITNTQSWLGLDFFGRGTARDIYGAVVEVTTDLFSVKRTLNAKQGFLSQGDPRVHIGLGASNHIKTITIQWPDGQSVKFDDVTTNQYYQIDTTNNTIIPIQKKHTKQSTELRWQSQLDDAALMVYSNVLLQAPHKLTRDKLKQIWRSGPDSVKANILKHIEQHWDIGYLPIVRESLLSTSANLRLAGIEILKQTELETSVAWLLPLLNDPNSKIQCAVADTFAFFFEEEEAVTHRKKLAISPLIKLLKSGSSTAKICASNALAAAENKRAITPLLKLATTEISLDVRTSAIRALGLIRDTSVITPLTLLAQSPKTEASVIAAALIALKRLNEPTLDLIIDKAFSNKVDHNVEKSLNTKRLQILTTLFSHPDGIIFQKKQLKHILIQLLKEANSQSNKREIKNNENIIAALQAIAAGKLVSQLDYIEAQLKQQNKSIQLHALIALSSLNTKKTNQLFETTLSRKPLSLLSAIIAKNKNESLNFSNNFLSALAKLATSGPQNFNELKKLLTTLPGNAKNKLFNSLLDQELTVEQHQSLFDFCASGYVGISLTQPLTVSEAKYKYPSTKLRYAYATCYFTSARMKTGNINHLKKRIALKSFMAEEKWNEYDKTTLLLKASESDSIVTKTILLKRILTDNRELFTSTQETKALRVIAKHGLTSNIETRLWRRLEDTEKTPKLRLESASLLMGNDNKRVLSYLEKRFKHD